MTDGGDDGATPLTADERAGLRLSHIATRGELNEAEQDNILAALRWTAARQPRDLLTIGFLRLLHRRMFGEVWAWAGEFSRERRRAIGLDGPDIAPALQMLFDDTVYWIAHDSFALDMIAARFHQRLTQIHPFPNGNGRHARLMTDLLLRQLGRPDFTWGADDLRTSGEARRAYVAALRKADGGEFDDLLAVARR